jgi:hypothetical protein
MEGCDENKSFLGNNHTKRTYGTPARLQRWQGLSPSSAPTHFIWGKAINIGMAGSEGGVVRTLALRHTVQARAPLTTGVFWLELGGNIFSKQSKRPEKDGTYVEGFVSESISMSGVQWGRTTVIKSGGESPEQYARRRRGNPRRSWGACRCEERRGEGK